MANVDAVTQFIYVGQKFYDESGGVYAYLVDASTRAGAIWDDLAEAIFRGDEVYIRPASKEEIACAESNLAIMKANKQSALC